jgi:hypothetical protein
VAAKNQINEPLDPVLLSWLDNVIVPALVDEYLRLETLPAPEVQSLPRAA